MELNRRSFLSSLFAGAMLVGAGSLVEIFYEHEHYTAREGIWNIWYRQDDFWYLLSDSHRAPLEFDSRGKARDYSDRAGFTEHDPRDFYDSAKNGEIVVRPAPTKIHDMNFLRQSSESIARFLKESQITDPVQVSVASDLLSAQNGYEQSKVWIAALSDPNMKRRVMELHSYPMFCELLRTIYCSSSYHAELAKLYAFRSR